MRDVEEPQAHSQDVRREVGSEGWLGETLGCQAATPDTPTEAKGAGPKTSP